MCVSIEQRISYFKWKCTQVYIYIYIERLNGNIVTLREHPHFFTAVFEVKRSRVAVIFVLVKYIKKERDS